MLLLPQLFQLAPVLTDAKDQTPALSRGLETARPCVSGGRGVGGGDTLKVNIAGFLPADASQFRFAFHGDADDSVANIVMNAGKENISFGDNTDQFLIGNTNLPRRTSSTTTTTV